MKSKTRKKTQSETPKPKEIEKIVKPNARFHTNTVIYNDYIFMFGGTKSLLPSEQLNDFWRVFFNLITFLVLIKRWFLGKIERKLLKKSRTYKICSLSKQNDLLWWIQES